MTTKINNFATEYTKLANIAFKINADKNIEHFKSEPFTSYDNYTYFCLSGWLKGRYFHINIYLFLDGKVKPEISKIVSERNLTEVKQYFKQNYNLALQTR